MNKTLIVVPARMGSSRFPGKPLKNILGKPMIEWVLRGISGNINLDADIVVATCDHEIMEFTTSIGFKSILTSSSHERASDRCAEALLNIEEAEGVKYEIVVMVQGDEPMVKSEMILEAIQPLIEDSSIQVSNLMGVIQSATEFEDRNCIKVVCDLNSDALFFSREPIPSKSKQSNVPMRKQVCVIPFRKDYLIKYTKMKPTPLEVIESIDMLRIIESGQKVRMVPTNFESYSVDTFDDLLRVEKIMSNNFGYLR